MERWSGRVALVTGASIGIGASIAYKLQDHGVHVVAVARRVEKIEESASKAREKAKNEGRYHETTATPGKLYAKKCDIANEKDVLDLFKWAKETLGGIDIVVNNAGIGIGKSITDSPSSDWKLQFDVNVIGLSLCTREAVKCMRSRGVDDGHIIHIGSVTGDIPSAFYMYMATKQAVVALTEGLRKDFVEKKSNMKVTNVRPGGVWTETVQSSEEYNAGEFGQSPVLQPDDVADAVLYTLGTPPHVQIHEIIIKPVGELF